MRFITNYLTQIYVMKNPNRIRFKKISLLCHTLSIFLAPTIEVPLPHVGEESNLVCLFDTLTTMLGLLAVALIVFMSQYTVTTENHEDWSVTTGMVKVNKTVVKTNTILDLKIE